MAATSSTCQANWLRKILADFGQKQIGAIDIHYDNKETITFNLFSPKLFRSVDLYTIFTTKAPKFPWIPTSISMFNDDQSSLQPLSLFYCDSAHLSLVRHPHVHLANPTNLQRHSNLEDVQQIDLRTHKIPRSQNLLLGFHS